MFRQTKSAKPDQVKQKEQKQPKVENGNASNQAPALYHEFADPSGNSTIQAQAALLSNPGLLGAQRRAMATNIGQAYGNQHLLQVMKEIDQSKHQSNVPSSQPEKSDNVSSTSTKYDLTGVEVVTPPLRSAPSVGRSQDIESTTISQSAVAGASSKAVVEAGQGMKDPIQTKDEKINYVAASTPLLNDADPGGDSGLTKITLADVSIKGEVYEDSGHWKIKVTSASTTIHWGIKTDGYKIPNPKDGGNITKENWKDVVKELKGYEARKSAGSWHHPDASKVHEKNHIDWFKSEIIRTWPGIETKILAHDLGANPPMKKAGAEAALATYLNTQQEAWFDAYGVAPEPPAYAAGQAVLNKIIGEIEAYAKSKKWTP